jgi:hypothetical protein
MADIFSSLPGRVALVASNDSVAGVIGSVDLWEGFPSFGSPVGFEMQAIFTGTSHSEDSGHQFRHSLSRNVYLYVFGDRVGEMMLSGIGFGGGACNALSNPVSPATSEASGVSQIIDYYEGMRLTTRASSMNIVLANDQSFQAYLIKYKIDALPPEWAGAANFSFLLRTVPRSSVPRG